MGEFCEKVWNNVLVFIDINLIVLAIANGAYGQFAAALGFSVAAALLSMYIAIRGL